MKHISIVFAAFLLAAVGCSCNGNKGEEDDVMEEHFIVYNLIPNDNVKETLSEYLLPFVTTLPDDYGDTICIEIESAAYWSPLENDNMFSMKITELDTARFYLVINDDTEAGHFLVWEMLSNRPLLRRPIKTILDTGTYYLHSVDGDEWAKSYFDDCREYGAIVLTDIDFKMYFLR